MSECVNLCVVSVILFTIFCCCVNVYLYAYMLSYDEIIIFLSLNDFKVEVC